MEPWSFGLDGKGLLFSDEMDSPLDAFERSRKSLMEMETRPYYNFENSSVLSDKVEAESVEFMELGFNDAMRRHFHCNQAVGVYGGEVGSDSGKRVVSPTCMLTPNSSLGEVESISVKECNSQDSSLIDLKLGRLVDGTGANTKFSKGRSVLASGGSAVVAKRARTTPTNSHTAFCQVQGCNMDLTFSKEYHKRHKVCDAHSKTARVIVNGIEQRFCQQCSRFHLLVEFDDGKRSCRKRLAGHNERRRKPQLDSFSGKHHKFLHSIQDTRFLTSSLPKRSPVVFPNIHRGGNLYQDRYGEANEYQHIKSERESIFNPQMAVPMMNIGKSFHLHNIGKQHCSRVPLDTASHVEELSEASNSSCALSLLSTQSQGIPLFYPGEHVGGERLGRMNSGGKYAANGFYSNPVDVEQIMLSDADFEVHSKGIFHGSGFSSYKHSLSPEHGATVDLLQLSSHLQRVERQRGSMPVKQESEDFSCFLATQGV